MFASCIGWIAALPPASTGWSIAMQHGRCSSSAHPSSKVTLLLPSASNSASEAFEAGSINFTKASCTDGFMEHPSSSDWSDGHCLTASAHVCLAASDTTLIRIVLEFSGAAAASTTLYIDDKPAAWYEKQDWRETGLYSSIRAVDTLLLLGGRCHKVVVVYDDGMAAEESEDESTSYRNKV
jgi:hypothetical protein